MKSFQFQPSSSSSSSTPPPPLLLPQQQQQQQQQATVVPPLGKRPSLSKKDLEEQKKKQEEQEAAKAFEEYVAVFQDNAAAKASSKVWIKAGTYDAGKRQEDTKEKGKLYKPTSRFEKDGSSSGHSSSSHHHHHHHHSTSSSSHHQSSSTTQESSGSGGEDSKRPEKPGSKKKQSEKKKSNLEIFKEELKIIQEEREERHRLKRMLGLQEVIKLPPKPGDDLRASLSLELDDVRMGSIDDGDPNTTNIYLGNLPTKISEQQLMEVFGKYGPLASVKVMWPRTEEEKARNRLSGFVAFMSRRDGERALKHLAGKEVLGSEIKLGWGKAVPIPAYPVYIPPAMLELTMPPPLSGLPFNAQVDGRREKQKLPPPGTPYPTDPKGKEEFEKLLYNATVKVVMPTDRALLVLIHRMVEFVIREGPMFEAMIMNKEINNPQFRFLFENQSPAHVYYRWKLYSILQGDSTSKWRTEEFRMFRGGSIWRPPKLNPFTQGMPDELIPEEEREIRIGSLSNAQRTRLERMLRKITPDRHKVAEVMIFSIEHSESTDEICQCIRESLSNPTTSLQKKIARMYVVNDVLHNCTAKGMNAFGYRKAFKNHLPAIFQELHYTCQEIDNGGGVGGGGSGGNNSNNNNNLEAFKQRIMACFKAWDEWGVYSSEFLIKLQNIFLGLASCGDYEKDRTIDVPSSNDSPNNVATTSNSNNNNNNNNANTTDDDDDEETARENLQSHRMKLHKKSAPPRAQLPPQSAMKLVKSLQSSEPEINEEIDGVPLEEDDELLVGNKLQQKQQQQQQQNIEDVKPKFIPSKWEELDPEEVKAQAVTTTSKWDLFEEGKLAELEKQQQQLQLQQQQEQKQQKSDNAEGGGGGALVGYDDEDIDGVPMEEDDDYFDQHHQRVATNSYEYEQQQQQQPKDSEDDERRRLLLRDVENKVLAFQDELEKRGVLSTDEKGGYGELVREYRDRLLRRGYVGMGEESYSGGGGASRESSSRRRRSSRSRSRSRGRSRSSRDRSSRLSRSRSGGSRSRSRDRRRSSKHSSSVNTPTSSSRRRRRSSSSSGGGDGSGDRRSSRRRR